MDDSPDRPRETPGDKPGGPESSPELIRFRTYVPFGVVHDARADAVEPGQNGSSLADAPGEGDEDVGPVASRGDADPRSRLSGTWLSWGGAGLALLLLAVLLPSETSAATLRPYRPGLLAAALAVAVFAVSLSFVIFQLAPYRSLIAGASGRHVASAGVVVAIALAPVVALAFSANASAHVAVAALPLVVLASVLLVRLAQREADPTVLISWRVSKLAVRSRSFALVRPVRNAFAEMRSIERPPRSDQGRTPSPMHELFHKFLPPPRRDDPLELLVSLATAAVGRGDGFAYSLAAGRALEVLSWVRDLPVMDDDGTPDWEVRTALVADAERMVDRIGQAGLRDDQTSAFADQFVNECLRIVRGTIANGGQGERWVVDTWDQAVAVAAGLVKRGFHSAPIATLMVGRLAVEHGLVTIEDWDEEYRLNAYVVSIEELGRLAIDARDTDFLYRCLEALAWMGCAAVREDARDVCAACLQALAQLGREVRVADLECFWQKCLLTPYDHVDERIFWVLSWVQHAPEPKRNGWCQLIGEALSRLHGYRVKVTMETDTDGELQPRAEIDRAIPHHDSINDNGRLRTIDYSDDEMLKELELR